MGKMASEPLEIDYEGMVEYLHYHSSVYMRVDDKLYYLTDCNFEAWRAQDTAHRNHKGHYIDCSPLVPTVDEFLAIPFHHGMTIKENFDHATFYASESGDKE